MYEKIYQILRHCRHYFRSASVRTPCHSSLQWERASFRWISTGLEWCYHICKGRAFSLIPIFKGGREGGLTGFFVKYVDVFRIVLKKVEVKHQRKKIGKIVKLPILLLPFNIETPFFLYVDNSQTKP